MKYLLFLLSKPSAISHWVCLRPSLKSQEMDKGPDMYWTTHSRALLQTAMCCECVLLSAVTETHSAIRLSKEELLHSHRSPSLSVFITVSDLNLILFLYVPTACEIFACPNVYVAIFFKFTLRRHPLLWNVRVSVRLQAKTFVRALTGEAEIWTDKSGQIRLVHKTRRV